MLEINSEIKFFNRSNIFILGIMWGSYIVLILINYYPVKELINFTNTIDYISLFAALSAITGILYSNYKSDQRSILSINQCKYYITTGKQMQENAYRRYMLS